VCFHLYYLHFCISLYTCANVICIKLLLTYCIDSLLITAPSEQWSSTSRQRSCHVQNNVITASTSRRHLRSAARGDLQVLACRTSTFGPRSFAACAPNVWNWICQSWSPPFSYSGWPCCSTTLQNNEIRPKMFCCLWFNTPEFTPIVYFDPSLTLTQFCARLNTVLFCRAYETLA